MPLGLFARDKYTQIRNLFIMETEEIKNIASNSENRFQLWAQIIRSADVRNMAEVGVWKGDFTKQILKQCNFIERYYMVDPWANLPDWNKPFNVSSQAFDDVYDEAIKKTEFASQKIVVLRGCTKDVIDDIPDNSLDFVYIDGDHTLRGITIDLIKLFPKIKDGGIIAGDDFINNPWQHGINYEPTLICPFSIYFAEAMDVPFITLPFQQYLIIKTKELPFIFRDLTGEYSDISLNKLPSYKSLAKSFLSKFINI